MVEPQPSKLMVWVRFPSPAPSNVVTRFLINFWAHIAQSVERILGKDEVTSSNLVMGSIFSVCSISKRVPNIEPCVFVLGERLDVQRKV